MVVLDRLKIKEFARKILEPEYVIDIPPVQEYIPAEPEEDKVDYSNVSVQVLYRPVRQMIKIPDIPNDDVNSDGYKWWMEQIKRCLKGWIAPDGVYLNGFLYFYLNFVTIPIDEEGSGQMDWKSPLYRDNDHEIMDILWNNKSDILPNGKIKNARNHVEGKGRGIAWSTFLHLGVALWFFVFRNDKGIGGAYPTDKSKETARSWFIESWYLLHPMFKRWKGKELIPIANSKERFSIGYSRGSTKKEVVGYQFDVIGIETKAGVYKSTRLNMMIADEAGLFSGNTLKNYFTENEPVIKLGSEQWGMCVIGGTSNAIINKSTAYKEIWINHASFNMTRHFTAKTKVLRGFIDYFTGKSMVTDAYDFLMKGRVAKAGDIDAYQGEVMENPLVWEEAFMPSDAVTTYNTAKINNWLAEIRIQRLDKAWVRGKIEYRMDRWGKPTKETYFIKDPENTPLKERGDWYMNLEGKPNRMYRNLHVAAIDDKYKSPGEMERTRSSDSRNAMIIWRKPTTYPMKSDMPCAVYYGNPSDMMDAYREFYKGMLLYEIEDHHCLYEYNAEGFIMFMRDYMHELNRLYFVNGKPGIKISNEHVKSELTYLGTQFLSEDRHKNITFPAILESMAVWGGQVNTDIGSALHLIFKILELTSSDFVTTVKKQDELESSPIVRLGPNAGGDTNYNYTPSIVKLGPNLPVN